MTQKELLYIEDAIGHEQTIKSILEESINQLEDEKLISFLKGELKKHKTLCDKLIKMLEVKSDE